MTKKKAVKKKVVEKVDNAQAEDLDILGDSQTEAVEAEETGVPKEPHIGRDILIKQPSGAEFKGFCISARKINGGEQVFLRLNGCVSRWFSRKDIVE